ncbi:uncharacterized protein KD926_007143 [Aspergillus affinis]|uniref:uncharacterized protein n=1 Tax=Aspergillus affinis TaxID=1070780 RepID=UPI0022FEC461|nr:uncharacterized protein KD926_007143 [Aspergillus affinis]KAI9045840.1 hypothetical protein KD926_007143 [Aspergillus affinis]
MFQLSKVQPDVDNDKFVQIPCSSIHRYAFRQRQQDHFRQQSTVDLLKKATAVAKFRALEPVVMCQLCNEISGLLHPTVNAEPVPAAVTAALAALTAALSSAAGPAAATEDGVSAKTLRNRRRRASKIEKRKEAKKEKGEEKGEEEEDLLINYDIIE